MGADKEKKNVLLPELFSSKLFRLLYCIAIHSSFVFVGVCCEAGAIIIVATDTICRKCKIYTYCSYTALLLQIRTFIEANS